MRKFTRAAEPAVLQANCTKWNAQWVERCQAAPSPAFAWYVADGKSAREHILPALRAQTQRHCSFCDAFPVEGVSIETIEHFKPKSRFPEHAYTWTNLYYCCDACQNAKREQWDELLIQADADGYSFARYFEFDFTTGEIRPNPLAAKEDREQAIITIRVYGLDSEPRRRNRLLQARQFVKIKDAGANLDEWPYRDYLGSA